MESFRARLGEVIDQTGLSRSAFARKVGVDRSTLSQILSGQSDRLPRVETLAAIAKTEQVSVDWLIGLSEKGGLGADVIEQTVEIQPGGLSPTDERLAAWHAEAIGYKIRYVPCTLPDLMKTTDVIEYEYQPSASTTPGLRKATQKRSLDYQRLPETDMEVCAPLQQLENLAFGHGIWRGLPAEAREQQLEHMITLTEELYPTFRWFFYDELRRFSVPLTIFGPMRASIYLGQRFLVLNSRELIQMLIGHFDNLIRDAVVQPTEVSLRLRELRATIR